MRIRSYLGIGGGVAAGVLLLAGVAGIALGAGKDKVADSDVQVRSKTKMKVITVDDDGKRHEKVWVHDDDGEPGGWLGVHVGPAPDDAAGASVQDVIEDSPAERAGLEEGDVIVSVGGSPVGGPEALARKVRGSEPGAAVSLEVLRDGARRTLTAELGERPEGWGVGFDAEAFEEQMENLGERFENMDWSGLQGHGFFVGRHRPKLGVQLVEATPELREHMGAPAGAGVLVSKVLPGTPAEQSGVRVGDLITAFDGESVEDASDLASTLEDRSGGKFRLEVVRDRRPLSIDVTLPEDENENENEGDVPRPRTGLSELPDVEHLVKEAIDAAYTEALGVHRAGLGVRENQAAVQEALRAAFQDSAY